MSVYRVPRFITRAGHRRSITRQLTTRLFTWVGAGLLLAGLLCHLFAAQAIGGHYIAYRDHIAGFILLTVVSGVIVWGIGRRFWAGRHDITLLVVGVLQLALGILVYVNRFHIG